MVFSGAPSLGASSIIYGLVGISLIWAPRYEVTFFWFFLFRHGTFDVRVRTVAYWYLGLELFTLASGIASYGLSLSTELLHLMGAVIGIPIGVVMVRKGWVNCEGGDWFSVRKDKGQPQDPLKYGRSSGSPASRSGTESPDREMKEGSVEHLRACIAAGEAKHAYDIYVRLTKRVPEEDLRSLALLLFDQGLWRPCSTVIKVYIQRFPDGAAPLRLRLAAIAIREMHQPRKGVRLLSAVPIDRLNTEDRALLDWLRDEAARQLADNPLEFSDDSEFSME